MAGPRASTNPKPTQDRDWVEDPSAATANGEEAAAPGDRSTPLPPWARFPHVDPARHGRAFDDEDVPPSDGHAPASETHGRTSETRAEETQRVLREIDGLCEEVRPRSRTPEPAGTDSPAEAESAPNGAPEAASVRTGPPVAPPKAPVDLWDSPNSFLEERLRLADVAAADLGRDVRAIDDTWTRVRERVAHLEAEVKAAHEEMAFIHAAARGWDTLPKELPTQKEPAPMPVPRTAPAPTRPARAAAPVAVTPAVSSPAPYAGFTADRYNRTIGALKARRLRLAGWTFAVAGLISLALVVVTVTAKESMPPMWLAVLPAVWMIPVPFFVLSFRGTQRVLRHNHLNVPGGPP